MWGASVSEGVLTLSDLKWSKHLVMREPMPRFIETTDMVEGPFEDWSRVRSPGRARRRLRKGYRQNVRTYYTPRKDFMQTADGTTYVHPVTMRALMQAMGDRMRLKADAMMMDVLRGAFGI